MSYHTNKISKQRFNKLSLLILSLVLLSSFGFGSAATALGAPIAAGTTTKASVVDIISRGDSEITRRLATLSKLTTTINATTELSNADKITLSGDVSSESSGLTALKTQLDASTTQSAAISSATEIVTGYRVYYLLVPKVYLVKVADDQIATQTKLTTLAANISSHLATPPTTMSTATRSELQADLITMRQNIATAGAISNSVETAVIPLSASDYDTDHNILSGDSSQLKTAQADDQSALSEAKSILSGFTS